MSKAANNLRKLLKQLSISNVALARSISVDASLVSRWLNGQRQLKLSSEILDRLSTHLMYKITHTDNMEWLKSRMEIDGFSCDSDSSENLRRKLKIWLASDSTDVRKTLDLIPSTENKAALKESDHVKTGHSEISSFLKTKLDAFPNKTEIDIYLSREDTSILMHESVSRILLDSMLNKGVKVRLLISMTNDVKAMSQLVSRYMQPIIEGALRISVGQGTAQAVINQTTFVFREQLVFTVYEVPKSSAPPIGTSIYEESFIVESQKSFERAHNSSQTLLRRYNDNTAHDVIQVFCDELSLPGDLDVIKDNINPIYMATEAFEQFLRKLGYKGAQFKRRRAELLRYKKGMEDNLKNGTVFREMISLERLEQIIKDGECQMPGLYFFGGGIVHLDASRCLAVLEGYIYYMNRFPNFHIVILDEIPELHERSCWHIKQNKHWMLNGWNKDEHIILFSEQLILTHEFQLVYNNIWSKINYCEGHRAQTISVLQNCIARLKENHNI